MMEFRFEINKLSTYCECISIDKKRLACYGIGFLCYIKHVLLKQTKTVSGCKPASILFNFSLKVLKYSFCIIL